MKITPLTKLFPPYFQPTPNSHPSPLQPHPPNSDRYPMSSQRKIQSARTNGAKSHGPKTKQGLAKSSRNALTHGLYSPTIVLQGEPREKYQELLDAYIRQFQPEGPDELDLVEEMAAAKWRQRRLWAIETDLLEDEMMVQKKKLDSDGETYDEITPLSFAYRDLAASSALPFLTRHESRLERAYFRALKTLLELQRLRKAAPTSDQKNLQERTQSQPRNPPAPAADPPQVPPSLDLPPCAHPQAEHPPGIETEAY